MKGELIWSVSIIFMPPASIFFTSTCNCIFLNNPPEVLLYMPPKRLPAGTPLNTPNPGRISRAIFPRGAGLIADSGTSRTGDITLSAELSLEACNA